MKPATPRKPLSVEEATARAESLCARAECCSYEILSKLSSWGLTASQADAVIASLIDRRFIDDARFAEAFVRDKYRFSRWGRRKISLALSARRIPSSVIRQALLAIDPEVYEAQLLSLLRAKARWLEAADSFDGRTRLFRYAASRGFEPSIISPLLSSRAYLTADDDAGSDSSLT